MQKLFLTSLAGLVLAPALLVGATIGQVDTFSTGLDNWFAGGLGPQDRTPPIPPSVSPSGGPAGAGDAYMVITASSARGSGSRVVAINTSQWAGNYLTAGIGLITMDLKNFGTTDLTVRLRFEDAMGGPPADEALTNTAAFLPVGSGWMHFAFPISSADLTAVTGSATAVLTNATLLRIANSPAIGNAAQQVGVLGVDNITAAAGAAAVPEPGTVLLALTGAAFLVLVRRR